VDEKDLAYWAGYFDADGHVTGKERKDRRNEIDFRAGVTGSDLNRLEELKRAFGGSVVITHRKGFQWQKGSPVSTRTTYQWAISWKAAEKFLCAILPYLRTKRPQAETYLKARATFLPRSGRRKFLPQETWDARLNLLNCVKQLNGH